MGKHDGLNATLMPAIAVNGTRAIALEQPAAKTSRNKVFAQKPQPQAAVQWVETAEQITFWSSVFAGVLATVSQQAVFAVPLSLFIGFYRVNRYHVEQQMQQRLTAAMTEVAQVQTDLQRLSDRPLSDDVGSLWQRVETLEKADWQGQVTAVQQWVKDLDASAEALHDRTRHLDYIQEQLVALQEWVSAQSQCDRGRVAIFIDGTNLFSAAQKLGIEIDYAKLLAVLTAGSPLFRACFYMGVDSANKKQQDFLSSLRRHGYRVVSKELVRRADNSKKANLDVEIALDLISLVGAYDTAVLVSDNEEFACAIKAVSGRGARVEVVSLQSRKSNELIDVADCYINLETIKDEICKGSIPMPVKTPKD